MLQNHDHLTAEAYREELKRAYLGEFFGEALLLALADQFSSSIRTRKKLAILARLERVTQKRLSNIADGLVGERDFNSAFAAGRLFARTLRGLDWESAIRELLPRVCKAELAYSVLLSNAPENDRPELEFLLVHEQALSFFLMAELEGRRNSLEATIAILAESA